ncbi:winged helix-turn-helix transcriptional regulator [Paenibacillus piscarius]|uniref:winged helix-turn-helix transcriptional regulator n=1 Tax=Paenibacillus piscarius TaxID=1089681 RepID=UPI001EE840D2|nr:helix-turn-helix domain-containing protein [Paenibacillus piscarius]
MKSTELCPRLQKSMDLIGRRWTGLIIYQLLQGPQRFGEIEAALPVSGRLLSERLKELEQEGIVLREVFPETPVRIQYSLTGKGRALESVIRDLQVWSESWITEEECRSVSSAPPQPQ